MVYLIVGCLFTAAALADVAAFPVEMRRRRHELTVLRQYRDGLSASDITDIVAAAAAMFGRPRGSFDESGDGGGDDGGDGGGGLSGCSKEQFTLVSASALLQC